MNSRQDACLCTESDHIATIASGTDILAILYETLLVDYPGSKIFGSQRLVALLQLALVVERWMNEFFI